MSTVLDARTQLHGGQVRTAAALTILAGLWMIAAPWVLGNNGHPGAGWNDVVVGIVVIVLAAPRVAGSAAEWESWWIAPFGIWTIISPWVFGVATASPALRYNQLVLGIVLVLLAVWSGLATEGAHLGGPPRLP